MNMSEIDDSPSNVGSDWVDAPEQQSAYLELLNTVPAQTEEANILPHVDVVHVVGLGPERLLGIEQILENLESSRKREFRFQCELSGLVVGELAFDNIEHQAITLLNGILSSLKDDDTEAGTTVRIFIAYDLGALVLKRAIAISASREPKWLHIFYSTVQFVFRGCFHRRQSLQLFDQKLWKFLQTDEANSSWVAHMTPESIRVLADALIESTERFLLSRITLRTRIISIYTKQESEEKHSIFDLFTATLGVSTEIPSQETSDSKNEVVPGLAQMICYRTQSWVTPPRGVSLQRMLLPLALPQYQSAVVEPSPIPELLSSEAYQGWNSTLNSPILYITGEDPAHSRFLVDNMILTKKSELLERQKMSIPILAFAFDSYDPDRSTIESMICSAILQSRLAFSSGPSASIIDEFFELYKIYGGWTLKDLLNLFMLIIADSEEQGALIALYDVDQCKPPRSYKVLLETIQELSERSDQCIKIVVTSRGCPQSGPDPDDSAQSQLWWSYTHTSKMAVEFNTIDRLSPGRYGKDRVTKALQKLTTMEPINLSRILTIIENHTHWPKVPSAETWSAFCALLESIEPSSSPSMVLDSIIRDASDQEGARWVLTWVLYGHRPLSCSELAWIYQHRTRQQEPQAVVNFVPADIEKALRHLRSWLSALLRFDNHHVSVREFVREVTRDGPSYVWNDIAPSAHQEIFKFLGQYLTESETRERLTDMYDRYCSEYNADENHLIPSVEPDGEDFIFYAITAFPYHLEKSPEFIKERQELFCSSDSPLMPWARMYWAMFNAFSRPSRDTIVSPISIFLRTKHSKALNQVLDGIQNEISCPPKPSISAEEIDDRGREDALMNAISLGDEWTALRHARRLFLHKTSHNMDAQTQSLCKDPGGEGSRLLWRAVWLDMPQLTSLLLGSQMISPSLKAGVTKCSALYMASLLGHLQVAKALIDAGADLRVRQECGCGAMQAAAANGHHQITRALVTKDSTLLETDMHDTPLSSAARWGKWSTVQALVELKAQVDFTPNGRTPLVIAAGMGYTRTVRCLLENQANPNLPGPYNIDTPLWFAAIEGKNVDCIRAMLEYGADPNHELLRPPLILEICRSSRIRLEKKIEMLEVLVGYSIPIDINKPDGDGVTALIWAAEHGHCKLVEWLLAHQANPNLAMQDSYSALYFAVINSHPEVIRKLLAEGASVNGPVPGGDTLLGLSIDHSIEQIEMLLEAGVSLERESDKGITAFNAAVQGGKSDTVKFLIDRKADIHHGDGSGWSPIHDATGQTPNATIVRLLAASGADLKATTKSGQTPLHLAATWADIDVIAALLEFQGALDLDKRNDDGETPLVRAVQNLGVNCIRRLLQAGANINTQCSKGLTPLMNAIELSSPDKEVQLLLSWPGLDISRVSLTKGAALHMACRRSNLAIVTQLLEKGADINQKVPGSTPTPLFASCMPVFDFDSGSRDEVMAQVNKVVRHLVSHGAELNVTTTTKYFIQDLLCMAALHSSPSTINFLINEGLSANNRDYLGRYPIHYAAASGPENLQAVLMRDCTLLTATDKGGKTILHWAAQFGHVRTVEIILAQFTSSVDRQELVDEVDCDGWTALCWALRPRKSGEDARKYSEPYQQTETVRTLLKENSRVGRSHRMGQETETFTTLELAILHNASKEITKILQETEVAQTPGEGQPTTRAIQAYQEQNRYCDHCLQDPIWGPVWQCETCVDFDVCKKCYGQIDIYHGHLKGEDGDMSHTFKLRHEVPDEIQEIPALEEQESDESDLENEEDRELLHQGTESSTGDEIVAVEEYSTSASESL